MKNPELTQRQLFTMKRETLEKKVVTYYEATQNASAVIEYAVAIMVRNALVVDDFSFMFKELICEIFLSAGPNSVLRQFCPYFKSYFKGGEWGKVIERLFNNKPDYHRFCETTRQYSQRLKATGSGRRKNQELQLRYVAVFADVTGKKHTLTLRNADEIRTKTEADGIFEILTTLSIFERAGVRRFAKFIKSTRPGTKETYPTESVLDDEKTAKVTAHPEDEALEVVKIMVPAGFDPTKLSEGEHLALIQPYLPEEASPEKFKIEFIEEKPPIKTGQVPAEVKENEGQSAEVKKIAVTKECSIANTQNHGVAEIAALDAVEKRPKQKRLTNKAAYVQMLIAKRRQGKMANKVRNQ